jgi:RNA polymerase sigma-70 factor (ECF subfamily)
MDGTELFTQYRPLLFSIAYCMLGNAMEAEDMVQETFLRWQEINVTEIESPKSFLATVITRLCIDTLRSARMQRESYIGPWLPQPLLTERRRGVADTVALAESLSLAFLVLLESLTPTERAALLLREVFEYEYAELAHILDKSEANCRQIVSRARRHLAQYQHPGQDPRFTAEPEEHEALTRQFVQACTGGDMDGLLELLADEAELRSDGGGKVVAARRPIYGAQKVARFLLGILRQAPSDLEIRFAQLNGQTGILTYMGGELFSAAMLTVQDGRVQDVYVIVNPDKLQNIPSI